MIKLGTSFIYKLYNSLLYKILLNILIIFNNNKFTIFPLPSLLQFYIVYIISIRVSSAVFIKYFRLIFIYYSSNNSYSFIILFNFLEITTSSALLNILRSTINLYNFSFKQSLFFGFLKIIILIFLKYLGQYSYLRQVQNK